jgi:two-component system KDP operon response regulator KdpE
MRDLSVGNSTRATDAAALFESLTNYRLNVSLRRSSADLDPVLEMALTRRRLLVVDTDPAIYRYLRRGLSRDSYEVAGLQQPELAPARAAEWNPDILVMATDLSAAKDALLIKAIRSVTPVPILGLLPGFDSADAIQVLKAGVDDCISQPFSLEELALRLEKLLRQDMLKRGLKPSFASGELQVDLVTRRVRRDGRELVLSGIQVKLLQLLMAADGGVVALKDLVQGLRAVPSGNRIGAVRSTIWSLRNKVETNPRRPTHILTAPRIGYRLASPSETSIPGAPQSHRPAE